MKKVTLIIIMSLFVFSMNTNAQELKTCETFIPGITLSYDSIKLVVDTVVGVSLYKDGKNVARINSKFQEFYLKNGILGNDEDGHFFMIWTDLRKGKSHKMLEIQEGNTKLILKRFKDKEWKWWYRISHSEEIKK